MEKLGKTWAVIILILGILLLLNDLNAFVFKVQPWTLVFLLVGLIKLFK